MAVLGISGLNCPLIFPDSPRLSPPPVLPRLSPTLVRPPAAQKSPNTRSVIGFRAGQTSYDHTAEFGSRKASAIAVLVLTSLLEHLFVLCSSMHGLMV